MSAPTVRNENNLETDVAAAGTVEWSRLPCRIHMRYPYKLVERSANEWAYVASWGNMVHASVFGVMGSFLVVVAVNAMRSNGVEALFVYMALVGVAAVAFSVYRIWRIRVPLEFDRKRGFFSRGKVDSNRAGSKPEGHVPLDVIHALQVVRFRHKALDYGQLNLVLHDGSRVLVVVLGWDEKTVSEFERLGRFLGRPCWVAHAGLV